MHCKITGIVAINFAIIFSFSCTSDHDSMQFETIQNRAIYGDPPRRTDYIQNKINHQQSISSNPSQDWANIMYSRSIGRFNVECNQKGISRGGSAFITKGNSVLTSRHTLELTGCDLQNLTPDFQIDFNRDRFQEPLGDVIDSKPPNLWLTSYRIHGLSLVETGALLPLKNPGQQPHDPEPNYNALKNQTFGLILTPNLNLFNDRDLMVLELDPMQFNVDFLRDQKPESKDIPAIVLYDRIPSPQNESQQISAADNNRKLWGYFSENDPDAVPQSNNQFMVNSQEGDWDIAFEPVPTSTTYSTTKIPKTQIISEGLLLRALGPSDFQKNCRTENASGMPFPASNLCFTMSVDLIQGASGGAIVYREHDTQSNVLLAGVITSGVDLINNVPDNDWNNINYVYPSTSMLADRQLTRGLTIDYSTRKQIFTGNDEDGEDSTNKESTFPQPTSCVGDCTDDDDSKMVFFSCARAFDLTYSFEWDPSMNEAHGLGFIGGPVNFVDTPNKITEVGSLGLVCSQSNGKDHMTTTNWPALKAIGLKKSFDHVHNQPSMFTGHNLMYMLQNTHLRVESSGNGAKYNYRPLPMKVCPPDSMLVGATFISEPGKPIAGVSKIRCEHSTKGRADFFLDATKYGHSPEFSQYIGRPFVDTNSSEVETSVECPQGERIRGISLHVDNQGTLGQQTRTKGLLLHCR